MCTSLVLYVDVCVYAHVWVCVYIEGLQNIHAYTHAGSYVCESGMHTQAHAHVYAFVYMYSLPPQRRPRGFTSLAPIRIKGGF